MHVDSYKAHFKDSKAQAFKVKLVKKLIKANKAVQ